MGRSFVDTQECKGYKVLLLGDYSLHRSGSIEDDCEGGMLEWGGARQRRRECLYVEGGYL